MWNESLSLFDANLALCDEPIWFHRINTIQKGRVPAINTQICRNKTDKKKWDLTLHNLHRTPGINKNKQLLGKRKNPDTDDGLF